MTVPAAFFFTTSLVFFATGFGRGRVFLADFAGAATFAMTLRPRTAARPRATRKPCGDSAAASAPAAPRRRRASDAGAAFWSAAAASDAEMRSHASSEPSLPHLITHVMVGVIVSDGCVDETSEPSGAVDVTSVTEEPSSVTVHSTMSVVTSAPAASAVDCVRLTTRLAESVSAGTGSVTYDASTRPSEPQSVVPAVSVLSVSDAVAETPSRPLSAIAVVMYGTALRLMLLDTTDCPAAARVQHTSATSLFAPRSLASAYASSASLPPGKSVKAIAKVTSAPTIHVPPAPTHASHVLAATSAPAPPSALGKGVVSWSRRPAPATLLAAIMLSRLGGGEPPSMEKGSERTAKDSSAA